LAQVGRCPWSILVDTLWYILGGGIEAMKTRWSQIALAALGLAVWCSPVAAQGSGATATSGSTSVTNPGGVGGNAGGSFGTGSTGGTAANVGTSSDVFGAQGLGSTNFTGGTGQTSISKANPFYYYYASPLAAGFGPNINLVPQNSLSFSSGGTSTGGSTLITGKGTFGAGMANITTGTTTTGKGGGGGGGSANISSGFNTIGVKRAPSYGVVADPDLLAPRNSFGTLPQLQQDLRASLQQSASLPSAKNLDVQLDNDTFVLTGTVATDRERRLAEGLVRMTPGVRNVRNNIQLAASSPRP
jgi:hypothetical protein